eukprot:scaffold216958_cov23-Tisochrysis_lutea.AAC.2
MGLLYRVQNKFSAGQTLVLKAWKSLHFARCALSSDRWTVCMQHRLAVEQTRNNACFEHAACVQGSTQWKLAPKSCVAYTVETCALKLCGLYSGNLCPKAVWPTQWTQHAAQPVHAVPSESMCYYDATFASSVWRVAWQDAVSVQMQCSHTLRQKRFVACTTGARTAQPEHACISNLISRVGSYA